MSGQVEQLKLALRGRYTIERELGSGGMSVVYLGVDVRHSRNVAIKVLRPELVSEIGLARFEREIETVASLSHPNILPLLDSDAAGGVPYMVMPYVEGGGLRGQLQREGRLSIEVAISRALDVADALRYAHECGCIHRDIKPENILLQGERAVVSDFGIARAIDLSGGARLSSTGLVVGTPAYMSPEQASGEKNIDGRADIYALGCVVYEMLSGEPPFDGPTTQAIIAKQIMAPLPPLTVTRSDVPAHIALAVEKALSKAPADRFETADQFALALTDHAASGAGKFPSIATQQHRERRSPLKSPMAWVIGVASILLFVFWFLPLSFDNAYSVEGARQKFIVLTHALTDENDAAASLAREAERELTRMLTGWDEARVVPAISKAGFVFDLGLPRNRGLSLNESIALARAARVGTLVAMTAEVRNDSAYLETQLYDVRDRAPLGDPISSAADQSDIFALVAPIASNILNLGGAPEQLSVFTRESSSLDALRQFQTGRDQLERWQLEGAERSFRAAITDDSTYARAHYYLSLTLYWQAARDVNRFSQLSGEIRRHAGAARRHGSTLGYRDSLFVEAFFSFQSGDFTNARTLYNDLVQSDSTSTYAWLLMGTVEYQDMWAEMGSDGTMVPRGNLNLARRAFMRTVKLSPDFSLGYGHLFDIYERLSLTARFASCRGYQPPVERVFLIGETRDAESQVYWCPVMRDSIEWVDPLTLRGPYRQIAYSGARSFHDELRNELRRWSEYAPDDPRPIEEQSALLMEQAALSGLAGNIESRDSLIAETLRSMQRALAMSSDTTPENLIRIGSLSLAAGDVERAFQLTQRGIALARLADSGSLRVLPREAVNVFLATGRSREALAVLTAAGPRRITLSDSDDRSYAVLVEHILARLGVYGAVRYRGPELYEAFDEIDAVWADSGYSESEKGTIRTLITQARALRWFQTALVLDESILHAWLTGSDVTEPVLVGHMALSSDSASARRHLASAMSALDNERNSATFAYLAGLLAYRLGAYADAVRAFDVVGQVGLSFTTSDLGWGLRSLRYLMLGRTYEAMGDSEIARRNYRRFLDVWENGDEELQFLVSDARAALSRIE